MWERLNRFFSGSDRIADKLFFGLLALLVLVLGVVGSVLIYGRLREAHERIQFEIRRTSSFLEKTLPVEARRLNAKAVRELVEVGATEALVAVELFDPTGERIYIYERKTSRVPYDVKEERNLEAEGKKVGSFVAYYSITAVLRATRLREFLNLLLLVAGAGVALGGGLSLLARRVVLAPIEKTLAFSRDLSRGEYDRRLQVTTTDELGRLQDSLNRMADSLQGSVERLKKAYLESERSRKEAQEGSRLKSEFLATMSHEIRTPLHSILGFADLLSDNEADPERMKSLKTIRQSAHILLDHISDILDFSKIEAGRLDLVEEGYSLREIADQLRPQVELQLQDRPVDFRVSLAEDLPAMVRGDRIRVRQILLNLLANAAKFTPTGSIELSCHPVFGERQLLFRVADTGIGIDAADHEKIFDPFLQTDASPTRRFGGFGLGLSIARRLVERMGGRIWVESERGAGATFCFTLPFSVERESEPA